MKILLFAFMLLASLQSNGQKYDTTSWGSLYERDTTKLYISDTSSMLTIRNNTTNKWYIDNWTAFKYMPIIPPDSNRYSIKNMYLFEVDIHQSGLRLFQKWKSDTLTIEKNGDIKFIKVGDKVYPLKTKN